MLSIRFVLFCIICMIRRMYEHFGKLGLSLSDDVHIPLPSGYWQQQKYPLHMRIFNTRALLFFLVSFKAIILLFGWYATQNRLFYSEDGAKNENNYSVTC